MQIKNKAKQRLIKQTKTLINACSHFCMNHFPVGGSGSKWKHLEIRTYQKSY